MNIFMCFEIFLDINVDKYIYVAMPMGIYIGFVYLLLLRCIPAAIKVCT